MSNYVKQNFGSGQLLKAEHLNHIEEGIINASSQRVRISDNSEIIILNNTEYLAMENLNNLTITLPEVVEEDFRCSLDFGCGDTATSFTYPENILWSGDNLNMNKVFVPVHNHRYHIDIWFDGIYIRANASGVMIV